VVLVQLVAMSSKDVAPHGSHSEQRWQNMQCGSRGTNMCSRTRGLITLWSPSPPIPAQFIPNPRATFYM